MCSVRQVMAIPCLTDLSEFDNFMATLAKEYKGAPSQMADLDCVNGNLAPAMSNFTKEQMWMQMIGVCWPLQRVAVCCWPFGEPTVLVAHSLHMHACRRNTHRRRHARGVLDA